MKAIFERFDGSRTIQSPSSLTEESNVMIIPRRSSLTGEIIDFMRFNKTNVIFNGLPLFIQSEEEISFVVGEGIDGIMPVNVMKRNSRPTDLVLNSNEC